MMDFIAAHEASLWQCARALDLLAARNRDHAEPALVEQLAKGRAELDQSFRELQAWRLANEQLEVRRRVEAIQQLFPLLVSPTTNVPPPPPPPPPLPLPTSLENNGVGGYCGLPARGPSAWQTTQVQQPQPSRAPSTPPPPVPALDPAGHLLDVGGSGERGRRAGARGHPRVATGRRSPRSRRRRSNSPRGPLSRRRSRSRSPSPSRRDSRPFVFRVAVVGADSSATGCPQLFHLESPGLRAICPPLFDTAAGFVLGCIADRRLRLSPPALEEVRKARSSGLLSPGRAESHFSEGRLLAPLLGGDRRGRRFFVESVEFSRQLKIWNVTVGYKFDAPAAGPGDMPVSRRGAQTVVGTPGEDEGLGGDVGPSVQQSGVGRTAVRPTSRSPWCGESGALYLLAVVSAGGTVRSLLLSRDEGLLSRFGPRGRGTQPPAAGRLKRRSFCNLLAGALFDRTLSADQEAALLSRCKSG